MLHVIEWGERLHAVIRKGLMNDVILRINSSLSCYPKEN
jgi:hypothetical protein